MERPCAWPTLYLEINGNDDDGGIHQIGSGLYLIFLDGMSLVLILGYVKVSNMSLGLVHL